MLLISNLYKKTPWHPEIIWYQRARNREACLEPCRQHVWLEFTDRN